SAFVGRFVGVLRAAREAPQLGLIDLGDGAGRVPVLGHDVEPVDKGEIVVLPGAVLAYPLHWSGRYTSRYRRQPGGAGRGRSAEMITVPAVRAGKGGDPLVMVTAYDAPGARIADEAGVDLILVGDSLAMVVLGYDDTLQVTVDDMAHHVAAVARARPRPMVVGDLPWLSYHVSVEDTVRNAAALVRAGAQAVKLEGGRKRLPVVDAILGAEIPVMGHLGLTPQSMHAMGGFKVQGRQPAAVTALLE